MFLQLVLAQKTYVSLSSPLSLSLSLSLSHIAC